MEYITSKLFERYGIPHGFMTRRGGVSVGEAFGSLNVSSSRKDADLRTDSTANVDENYRRIFAEFGTVPERCVNATQTHSDIILEVKSEDGGLGTIYSHGFMPECDGLLLRPNSGIDAVCVKTADCTPVIFANTKTGSVCAVHAGWRGTVKGIAAKAAALLAEESDVRDVIAAIGPCIGKCCYEVGEEVRRAAYEYFASETNDPSLSEALTEKCFAPKPGGKFMADLVALNREIIALCGVPEENIDSVGLCTCCTRRDGEPLFFSHRASGGHSGGELTLVKTGLLKIDD